LSFSKSSSVCGIIRDIAREEVFGPIAPIIVAEDDKKALDLANDTPYGLAASIWTPRISIKLIE
jgi:acyl-CoA reductase-like NAD-dependent aldehyde dehydrogenase